MAQVKEGDTIRIHYVGRLEDGSVFDSSEGGASLEMKIGRGEFIKGLEEGVIGMVPGETRSISMTPDKAYGPCMKEKIFEFHKDRISEGIMPEVGQQMQLYRADGMPIAVKVIEKTETGYIMDANHALAGQNLIFDVILEEIVTEEA
ncbi:MAG: FKBP-type peptidyl-prolyl cis-trans isomerase [Nitrospirae bacterium]|nr:FKBP-type peptidyl-prolyl cis-trans isomerase [Nitrospirota bacterium]